MWQFQGMQREPGRSQHWRDDQRRHEAGRHHDLHDSIAPRRKANLKVRNGVRKAVQILIYTRSLTIDFNEKYGHDWIPRENA